nr:hypothetical protein [Candidatus Njordarchaeum guaymaensis]
MKKESGKKALSMLLMAFMLLAMLPMFATHVRGATPAQIEASATAAVAYLASVQNLDGSWGFEGHEIAKTGLVLLKFLARAHELNLDPFDNDTSSPTYYEYANNVIAGFNYLLSYAQALPIGLQTHGDPDTNGNGMGIAWSGGYTYHTGIVLTAVALSGHPDDRSAVIGTLGSRTYRQIAQDVVDWLAFAQGDSGNARGGYGYYALNNESYWTDNSNAGYAYLGLAFAEDLPFSCTVPQWVKDELNVWITTIQDPVNGDTNDGGSWYNPDWTWNPWCNVLKTGNLIFEMAFYGDSPSTPRVQAAVDYLERHWRDPNTDPGWGYSLPIANYQAKFLIEKGLTYMGIDKLDTDGDGIDEDWYNQEPPTVPPEDFASVIVAQQLPSGGWPRSSGAHDYWQDAMLSTAWAVLTLERFAPPPEFNKRLVPEEGGLGTVVHVTISVHVGEGQRVKIVDTLPPEFNYISGTFKVNSVSATPTAKNDVITYTITAQGTYTLEFDVKVTEAYWEDRTVTNRVVGTWYDELGNMIEQKEATADFVIYAFEQLHKSVGIPKKVKVIPAPVQFWRQFIGGVTDIIVSDPPEWPEGVALVRDYAVLQEPMEAIPLELLTWSGTEQLPWIRIDKERPYILPPGEVAEYNIYTDEFTTAVLVRYTAAWQSTPDIIECHFVNEAILERKSPQVIVGQLSNFDVHNDYHEPVDNFELELYGIQPSDIIGWFPGWGAPPQITAIPGGTEVIWIGPPVKPCQWVHFGLHLKPGVIASGVKAYWTQLWGGALTIKEKTNVQWTMVFTVTNPFPYTMTNVVITDRFGAELEIDKPFPYSITHGVVTYTTRGMSRKIFLTWNVGNLLPGAT